MHTIPESGRRSASNNTTYILDYHYLPHKILSTQRRDKHQRTGYCHIRIVELDAVMTERSKSGRDMTNGIRIKGADDPREDCEKVREIPNLTHLFVNGLAEVDFYSGSLHFEYGQI